MSGHEALSKLTPEEQRDLLRKLLKQRASEDSRCPMSVQQQSLWFEYLRAPEWAGYNVFLPSRIRSRIDVEALHETIDQLVHRHACLRTTFGNEAGETYQQVHEVLRPEFELVDASRLSDEQIRQRCSEESVRPFSLESGPLLRLKLFQRSENDTIVIATTHHIVVDFWSLVLLLGEIRLIYDNLVGSRPNDLADAPSNYAAFVRHQQQLLKGTTSEELRRYWRKQLRDTSLVTEFPTDFVRPANFTGRSAVLPIDFPQETIARMSKLAKQRGATFPAVVLALIQTLVHRYTDQPSFLIGSPFSGRLQQSYESTVGFFVNMLPLRADISGDVTFTDLVDQAARTFVDSLQHEALPLAEIVRDAAVPRDASRSPLFQVCCTFEKSHLRQEEGRAGFLFAGDTQRTNLGGLDQESFAVPVQICHYDLEFMFERSDDGLRTMLCYCKDLFEQESMEAMATNLLDLADQLLLHPSRALDDLPWSSLPRHNGEHLAEAKPIESPWTVSAIRRVAEHDPDRAALTIDDCVTTYGELMDESDRIAAALARRGIGSGSYVPVIGKRGPSVVAALIGVLASGAAAVPIDAAEPAVTSGDLIEDTGASLVIVGSKEDWNGGADEPSSSDQFERCTIADLLAESPQDLSESSQDVEQLPDVDPDDLCYLIYTSGSSGRPKGVMTEHRALDNTLRWRADTVQLQGDDRVLILLSHQFDAGFGLIFSSLVQGAQLVWSQQPASNVEAIIQLIVEHQVTVLPTIPSLLSFIIDHPWFERCQSLRQVWTGGESMPSDLPQRLRNRRRLPFWNFYGPTEAAIEATAADVRDHAAERVVPIGTPVHNTEVLVLDAQRRRCPPTVPGELAISGPGLARGYLGRAALTAERFPILADGRRVFLTGDRGRERHDGSLEFLGRTDDQVKVGGYRIELQEIEQVLMASPHVLDAAVKVHQAASGHACLIGYIAPSPGLKADDDIIREMAKKHLSAILPPFKRPRQIIVLAALPKTSSGKVDRKRLPEVTNQQLNELPYDPPRTALERFLVEEFGVELGVGQVGITQDFFELGGTSLQAAVMASRLSDKLQLHVPTSLLFDMPDALRIGESLAALHRKEICERFGLESADIYVPTSAVANASDSQSPSHTLIAEMRGSGRVAANSQATSGKLESSDAAPIFMIHPPGGIVACYRELGKLSSPEQAFYAIRSRGLHGNEHLPESVEEMASDYVAAIRATVTEGPYQIGGWSLGGIVAWEVARQLIDAGESVERLILLDTAIPDGAVDGSDRESEPSPGLEYGLEYTLDELAELQPDEQLPLLWEHAKKLGVLDDETPQEIVDRALNDLKHLFHHHLQVIGSHSLRALPLPVLLVRPRDVPRDVGMSNDRGWAELASQVTVEFVSGHHHSMVKLPGAGEIASLIYTH